MRPLQLTLNFFGPYRHQQIDFTKFDQTPMFLISGPTGAGKSTIFDGLVFALYDKASGSQRESKEFRSDFATFADETSVELTFTHRGHYYQLIRKPKQTLAKKRGQGTTEQAPQIELTVYEDETPTKEIKQLTKIDQANKYLAELLQLNAAQFRQIVLLPQGEFRQFLNGDSNEKEAVLRNLFQTQHYEKWVKQLQTQYKTLKDENGQKQQQIATLLQQIDWTADLQPDNQVSVAEQLTLLQQQLKQMLQVEKDQQQQVADLRKKIAQQQTELNKRQQIQALFLQRENGQVKLAALKQQEPEILRAKEQLKQLQWVQAQQNNYQDFQQAKVNWSKATQQLQTAVTAAQKIKQAQEEVAQKVEALKAHEAAQAQFQQQYIEYTALVPKYQQVTKLEATQHELEQMIAAQQNKYQQGQTQLATTQTNIQTLKAAQQKQPDFYQVKRELDQQQDQLQQQQLQIEQLLDLQQQINESTQKIAQQQSDLKRAQQQAQIAQQHYQQVRSNYAVQQIAILQQDLLPGQPCPVCGSLEHPNATVIESGQPLVTDGLLEQADQQRQQAEQQVNAMKSSVTALQEKLAQAQQQYQESWLQLQQQFDSEPTITAAKQLLVQQQQELQQVQTKLEQQQKLAAQQEQELQEQENNQQELTSQSQTLRDKLSAQQQQLAVIVTQIKDIQQQLPEQFNSAVELSTFLKQLKQQIDDFKKQQAELQQQSQQLQQQQTENTTDQRHYQQQVQAYQDQSEQLQNELTSLFAQKWPEQSFVEQSQQYENLLDQLNLQQQLTQQVSEYDQQIVSQQAILNQLAEQLQSYSEVPDVEQAQLALQQLQQEQSQLQEQLGQVKSQILQQTKISQQITILSTSIIDITPLQELSELTRGNGSQKLGLERYVLQTYLAQVLLVANQRLAKLTKGRYRLALAQELGSARKNSGLELNVFDDYVGDYRSVRTLSGGESFIAALALALALGEVVQQQTGAIEINALFIDEGFGSLDEEALNTAIEALMSLENHQRMIGIISHVHELQTQIPAQLKVISHGNGESSIRYQLADE